MQTSRIVGLDTLRAAAITMVVLYHFHGADHSVYWRSLTHFGWIGVDLFFVLSGYLIAGQLFSTMTREPTVSIPRFYARRFLRTLPSYYAVLGLVIAGEIWNHSLPSGRVIGKFLVFIQNFGVPPIFTVSWSLCVEEHFYLFFPLLVVAISKSRPALFKILLVIVIGGGLILRAWLWLHFRPDQVSVSTAAWDLYLGKLYYPTYARLDGLTAGVVIAAVRYFQPAIWAKLIAVPNRLFWSGMCLVMAALMALLNQFSFLGSVIAFPVLACGFGLILVAATTSGFWLGRLVIPGISQIALLSYAIYLTHLLAMEVADHVASRLAVGGFVKTILSVVMIILIAAALHYLVERPGLKLRDRWFSSRRSLRPLGKPETAAAGS